MVNFDYIWQNAPSVEQNSKGIYVGEISHSDSVDLVLFFNRWCQIISNLTKLQKKRNKKYTQQEKILEKYRMCTYEEFEYLHNPIIDDDQFRIFHVFKSLDCYSVIERGRYTKKYEYSKEGYLKFIKEKTPKDLMKWIKENFSNKKQIFPLKRMEAHTYIVAPTQSGKSTLIRHLIHEIESKYPHYPQVIIDPHGELSQDLIRTKMHDVVYLNIDLHKDFTFTINLFEIPNHEEKTLRFAIENLVDVLNSVIETKFTGTQKSVLQRCIDFLMERGNSTMKDFTDLLDSEDEILKEAQEYDSYFELKYLKGDINRTRQALARKLDEIMTRGLKPLFFGKSTIQLEKLINSGKTIIFDLGSLPPSNSRPIFGKILLTYIKNILFERQEFKNPLPLFLYLDECQVFVSGTYEVLLSQMRKFGVRLVLANQFFNQLLNESTKHAIEQNTAIKVVRTNKLDDTEAIARVPEKILSGERRLKEYEFICDIWYQEPTVFKSSDLLLTSDEYYYNEKELEGFKMKQVEKYYKPMESKQTVNKSKFLEEIGVKEDSDVEDDLPFDLYLGEDAPDTK